MSQDREFEDYLQGKSSLSDLYADLRREMLPGHLDAAILAEAHRAAGARPGAKPRRSWVIPLSMAAGLFVVVVIGLQLPYLLPRDTAPGQMRHEEKQKASKGDVSVPDRNVPAKAAPQAPAAPAEAPIVVAGKPAGRIEQTGLVEQKESGNRVMLQKEKSSYSRAEGSTTDTFAQPAPTVAAMAAPEAAAQASEPKVASKADLANLPQKDWLGRIRQLKQQGKLDEAKKELAAFRKRYPDYAVPKDIEMR